MLGIQDLEGGPAGAHVVCKLVKIPSNMTTGCCSRTKLVFEGMAARVAQMEGLAFAGLALQVKMLFSVLLCHGQVES